MKTLPARTLLTLLLIAPTFQHAEAQKPKEKIKITFWRTFSGPSGEAQEELVRRFNASQDEVEVQAQFQGIYLELSQKLQASLAARQLPDVVTLDTGLAIPFARAGVLEPLDALMNSKNGMRRSNFYPGMLELGQLDGKQHLIPFAISTPVLYYNKDLLAKTKVKVPKTWDQFYQAAQQISNATAKKTFGASYEIRFWWWQPQVWAQGGQLSNAKHETFVDSKVWVDELRKLRTLVCQDKSINLPSRAAGGTQGDFSNQRSAMVIASSSQLANFITQSKNFKLGVAPLPGGPAGNIAPLGGSGLVIPKGLPRERLQAAWKFVQYMNSPQANAYFASRSGYLPTTKTAALAMRDFLKDNPLWRVPVTQMQHTRGNSELHDTRDGQPIITNAMQHILQNCEDPTQVLKNAQQEVQAALQAEGLR